VKSVWTICFFKLLLWIWFTKHNEIIQYQNIIRLYYLYVRFEQNNISNLLKKWFLLQTKQLWVKNCLDINLSSKIYKYNFILQEILIQSHSYSLNTFIFLEALINLSVRQSSANRILTHCFINKARQPLRRKINSSKSLIIHLKRFQPMSVKTLGT